MNVGDLMDSLLQVQWTASRMDNETPEWEKVIKARDEIAEAITGYIGRLENQCKNTQAK